MATQTKLAQILNGLVQNIDLSADELQLGSVRYGGGAGTLLDKTTLDSLIANSHASGSDNQTITAGAGLTGGGSGATVTVNIGAGTGMLVNADDIAIDFGTTGSKAISATDLAATTNGKGASLIGIEDANTQFTGTNMEAALDEAMDAAQAAQATADAAIPSSEKGSANGVATLDGSGLLPASQLPISAMTFDGNYNATTNTPTLANTDTGKTGTTYRVNVAGSQDFGAGSLTFEIGDWVYNDGSTWLKGDNIDQVTSVAGKTGIVTLDTDDVSEGTNLYYTDGRFDTRFNTKSSSNLNHTQADAADWTTASGTSIAAHLDEIGDRAAAIEAYDSTDLNHTQTDTNDWTLATGSTMGAHLDELADRMIAVEADNVSDAVTKDFVAGQSFTANTTYAVRMSVSGETDGRVYAVGATAATGHVMGIFRPTSGITAGTTVSITMMGEVLSSTAFTASQDEGKAVYADTSGNPTLTAPTSGAVIQLGMVQLVGAAGTAKILVQSPRLVGVA